MPFSLFKEQLTSMARKIFRLKDGSPNDAKLSLSVVVENDKGIPVPTLILPNTSGTTKHFTGTATENIQDIPSEEGTVITEVLIINKETTTSRRIDFSLDGGATFSTLPAGGAITWDIKGDIKQISIIRNGSIDADFDVILNRKD